jgi:chromosomal replication initiation ATPase DnaA
MEGDNPRPPFRAHPQLTLNLAPEPGHDRENFFVSASNATAYEAIGLWPHWPDYILMLLGPPGAGKSHLGAIWARAAGASIRPARALAGDDIELLAARPLLLEDADAACDFEAQLFHLVNLLRERRLHLLVTAKTQPDAWGLRIPDLLSRLRLAPTVSIGPPDDALLRAVLVKLLVERQLAADDSVVTYAAARLERSLDKARAFVDALDREALARHRRVTRAIAKDVLSAMERAQTSQNG